MMLIGKIQKQHAVSSSKPRVHTYEEILPIPLPNPARKTLRMSKAGASPAATVVFLLLLSLLQEIPKRLPS